MRRLGCALSALLALGLLSCSPDPLDRARRLQDERGDHAAALAILRELIDEQPGDAELQYRYGAALLGTGQFPLALWPLQNAVGSPEWREPAQLALASAFLASDSHDSAIATLSELLEEQPDHIPALLLRAHVRNRSRRDYPGALADADRVLELDPENTDALPSRTVALLGLGRVEEAAAALEELESLHRDDALGLHGSPGFCTARAKFAEEKGDVQLAAERYARCLEAFPAEPALLEEAVSFFDAMERPGYATELIEKALESAPHVQAYRLALASRLRSQDRMEEALAVLRSATEHESPAVAADAWANLASFHMQEGDYEAALEAFAEANRLTGGADPQLQFAHADALVIAGRHDKALELAETLPVPAYRALVEGRVALLRGDSALAQERFDEGLRLWPDNAYARYYAAVAAEQLGDFERAVEDYRYAMRIDAQATDAYLRLARLQKAAGRSDLALAALRFRPGQRQREVEAALLEMRILAEQGQVPRASDSLRQRLGDPDDWGRALAEIAAGVRVRAGAAAAADRILAAEDLDLGDPRHAEALEALVEHLHAAKRGEEALRRVEAALRERPDEAVFHALRGRCLALASRGAQAARAALERALEIDSGEPLALRELARLEVEAGDAERAVDLYERALAADAADRLAALELAALLGELGRAEEAEERLAALLRERPHDAEAALALAEQRVAGGSRDERTRELARRAARFGGGPRAARLLERLGAAESDAS